MSKNCLECVYRADDNHLRCTTPERFRDDTVLDCCVPEKRLRQLQREAWEKGGGVEQFIAITQSYITKIKQQSAYWRKQIKTDGNV